MSERDRYEPGVPCWVDHTSADPAAAARFYGELLGWETEDKMPPGTPGHYFMAAVRGREVAALSSQQSPEAAAKWNVYIAVADADEAVARAREAGATAAGAAFDVFEAGRMAVLADPAGADLRVWQARRHHGAALVNEPGAFVWTDLATSDVEEAKRFYGAVFGWQTTAMAGWGGEYTLWHVTGGDEPTMENVVGGMLPASGEQAPPEASPHWATCFAVEDADATAETSRSLGANIVAAPFDTPQGRVAGMGDPQGAAFWVIAPA